MLLPVVLLLQALSALAVPLEQAPLYHGCLDNVSRALPYCNLSLSDEERVSDILARLSLDEKAALLSGTKSPFCTCDTKPIDRIGLPAYLWLTETNSAIKGKGTTVFIGPLGMGASFNRSSWWAKGDVVSSEVRATNNARLRDSALTGFGPNINLVKDPRYGRNSEVPGEDPFLSGSYAVSYIHGLQQVAGKRSRLKMKAYVKHYTAYNVESNRFTFKANVSQFTFWDSYLPHYEMAFTKGGASGAMCSYFAPNGRSVCGDPWLLNGVIREYWQRPDTVIMSDCSAVANMMKNGYAHGADDASAKALNAGLDVYGGWGDNLWGPKPYGSDHLHEAIERNLTTEAVLDGAVRRTLMHKMELGIFDPVEDVPWTKVTADVIGSAAHEQVSYEAALQGMVLLKNSEKALPLRDGLAVAVVGPFANEAKGLFSDYAPPQPPFDTIYEAVSRVNAKGVTKNATGVHVNSADSSGIAPALDLVREADAVILALGITHTEEHEGIDRADTKLPGLQLQFAQQVFDAAGKKPVILTLCNGGVLILDDLVNRSAAIIEAFNPAQKGPRALAELIFGLENRWGKLPVTIYDEHKMQPLQDMSFDRAPGRSYRYYQGNATFRFGHGLSYTSFQHHCQMSEADAEMEVRCSVKNTGSREGDEVVMVFHRVSQEIRQAVDHPVPFKRLVAFERLTLAAGEERDVVMKVAKASLAITNGEGDYVLYKGRHTLLMSRGIEEDQEIDFDVRESWKRVNSHPKEAHETYLVV